jgi:hypothetical protein
VIADPHGHGLSASERLRSPWNRDGLGRSVERRWRVDREPP